MALPQGEFSRLLRELRSAGPVDRVRLLGRSVAALRGLSPWDRKVLLRMAGFEGAEALVERLAGGDRETAGALTRALAELEERPDELDRAVRKLGDPRRRGEAVDELLSTLDRVATAEPGPAEPAPERAAEAPADPAAPEPPPPARGPSSDPIPAAALPDEKPSPGVPAPPPPPPAAATPPAPPAVEIAPSPPKGPPAAAEARAVPAPEVRSEPRSEPDHEPPPPPSTRPPADETAGETGGEAAAPPRGLPAAAPVEPLEPALPPEAPSAVATLESLLDLRRRLDAGRRPDAAELRRLVELELPFPWARRRAIQAWLGAGTDHDLEDALGLVDTLPPGPDRTWCLATLAGARPWSSEAWRRIVDASASPAARRHLELRRRRA